MSNKEKEKKVVEKIDKEFKINLDHILILEKICQNINMFLHFLIKSFTDMQNAEAFQLTNGRKL